MGLGGVDGFGGCRWVWGGMGLGDVDGCGLKDLGWMGFGMCSFGVCSFGGGGLLLVCSPGVGS